MASPKPPKTGKKGAKKNIWKPFTKVDYEKIVRSLVHFSAKTTNSNTRAFGIRLGTMDRQALPFVSVSTINPDAVSVDYEENSGKNATILKQIDAVLEKRLDNFETVRSDDVAIIRNAVKELDERYETSHSAVKMRLRQIIVQDANGQDIALTPLQSAGFSKLLEARLSEEKESGILPNKCSRHRGYLAIGGSNPQNVGRHAQYMRRPLWFDAPHEDKEISKTFAIYHNGISLSIPKSLLIKYYHWRQRIIEKHKGIFPSNLEARDDEVAILLQAIVDAILDRAREATSLLEKHSAILPDENITSKSLSPIQQGLLKPSLRSTDWKKQFAKTIHASLLDAKVYVNDEWCLLGIGEIESRRWITIIEKLI